MHQAMYLRGCFHKEDSQISNLLCTSGPDTGNPRNRSLLGLSGLPYWKCTKW